MASFTPSVDGYRPLSITNLVEDAHALVGKMTKTTLPDIPIKLSVISLTNDINESQNLLSNLIIQRDSFSLTRTDAYRNFITKLISDTSSAFDKYYPDSIKISEPQEWTEDEKRLQYLGSKKNQMPESDTSKPETKEPSKTYSVSIQNLGDDAYVPTSVLNTPDQVVRGGRNKIFNTTFMNTMVNQADTLIKQIIQGYPITLRQPRFSGGKASGPFFDAPLLTPRSYNASDDIKQLFKDADTQLIFKKEAPVKYEGNGVDEKVTPETQRKIDLDELKIKITEGTENREEAEKEYELSMEKTSPEKLARNVG
jgi:hypothetical protein